MKTRRNELCPCGSGEKYKRCCLAEDRRRRDLGAARYRETLVAEILGIEQAVPIVRGRETRTG